MKTSLLVRALSLDGLQASMTVDGATDGDVFRAYVKEILCPNAFLPIPTKEREEINHGDR